MKLVVYLTEDCGEREIAEGLIDIAVKAYKWPQFRAWITSGHPAEVKSVSREGFEERKKANGGVYVTDLMHGNTMQERYRGPYGVSSVPRVICIGEWVE